MIGGIFLLHFNDESALKVTGKPMHVIVKVLGHLF